VLDEMQWPAKVVDFNYAPLHHGRMWRRGNKLSERLMKLLWPKECA
jgi:hypothetical protein